jgi:hypothetical protein
MPPFQFWFSGSAIGAFLALIVSATTLSWAWYNAALSEQKSSRSDERLKDVRAHLQAFYVEGGRLLERNIPKSSTDAEADKFQQDADEWLNRTNTWIATKLGPAASARFLDRSAFMARMSTGDVHPKAGGVKIVIGDFRQNLAKMIETNAWDAGEPKS